jgi:NhaA family Na+:H+ antiporter
VDRWLAPLQKFLHIESASGIVLLICTVVALVLANSPWAEWYASIWHTPVSFQFGDLKLEGYDLGHLIINDGLMAIFFFVVGLEIKRELVLGELREVRKALLPVFAAVGGMIVPAGIYYFLQQGQPGERGWAIPMATDIAFVVGILALFGPRIPVGLKILLLSLAIVDDLGAVLIIALVFTEKIALGWLIAAGTGLALMIIMRLSGVRNIAAYVVVGAFIWLAVLKVGIHPTVAGVAMGLLTPTGPWVDEQALRSVLSDALRHSGGLDEDGRQRDLERAEFAAREAIPPLVRLESALHPWVAFGIMPLFALANAGVALQVSAMADPVAIAVAAGLVLGKPLGILLFCGLAIGLGISRLPDGVNLTMLAGGACLAGIGFTMALFINGLAFVPTEVPNLNDAGKIGVLTGSVLSTLLGGVILWMGLPRPKEA